MFKFQLKSHRIYFVSNYLAYDISEFTESCCEKMKKFDFDFERVKKQMMLIVILIVGKRIYLRIYVKLLPAAYRFLSIMFI